MATSVPGEADAVGGPKPLFWVASARKDLREFPEEVRGVVGYALYLAQCGQKHVDALHAFQKKSTKGIETPKHEIDCVKERLRQAREHYREWKKRESSDG